RSREQHVKVLDLCFEAKFFEFRGDPFRVVFIVGRTNVVRMGSQALHVRTMIRRIGNRAHLSFPLALRARRVPAETEERQVISPRGMQKRQESHSSKQTDSYQRCALHEPPVAIYRFK